MTCPYSLETFSNGDVDYVAKLNANVATVEAALCAHYAVYEAYTPSLFAGNLPKALYGTTAPATIDELDVVMVINGLTVEIGAGYVWIPGINAVVYTDGLQVIDLTLAADDTYFLSLNAFGGGTYATTQTQNSIYSVTKSGGSLSSLTKLANTGFSGLVPLAVKHGGTGAQTLTDHGVLIGNATNAITATAEGATGQVLTGVDGAPPVWTAFADLSEWTFADPDLTPRRAEVTTVNAPIFNSTYASGNIEGSFHIGDKLVLQIWGATDQASMKIGPSAGSAGITGDWNIFIGRGTFTGSPTSSQNTVVGAQAGGSVGTYIKQGNTFIGYRAGYATFGAAAGNVLVGEYTTVLGGGDYNVAIGSYAGSGTDSDDNVAIGRLAGMGYEDNVVVGAHAGTYLGDGVGGTSAYRNILIGAFADTTSGFKTVTESIAIGYGATLTANNQCIIGSAHANGSITDIWLGQGVVKASAVDVTVHLGAQGSGINNQVGDAIWATGQSTDDATPARHLWQTTTTTGTADGTVQTLSTVMELNGATLTLYTNGIGTAQTAGLELRNETAAAAGAQQYSPLLELEGQGWETGGGSSDEVKFALQVRPVQGASASGSLHLAANVNGAGWSDVLTIHNLGIVTPVGQLRVNDQIDVAFGTDADARMRFSTSQTNDALLVGLDSTSRSLLVTDTANRTKDHDHAVQANPTIFVHSATDPDTANTQWLSLAHDQTDGVIAVGTGSIKLASAVSIADAKDVALGTTTGTKIGTATNQKLGFYNATPVVQQTAPAALTDSSGGSTDDTIAAISGSGADADINNNFAELAQDITALRTALVNLGLIA